jgi:hypothetical protein
MNAFTSYRRRLEPRAVNNVSADHFATLVCPSSPDVLKQPPGRDRSCGSDRGKDSILSMQGPNHVIRTASFPIKAGEDQETNPGVFGRALAEYLTLQIRARGESVEGIIPEDFGYCIMLRRKPFRLWVACGNRGERTDEWIAFAVAEGGLIRRALGTIDPSREVERLSELLGEIMREAPGVEEYSLESNDT